MILMGVILCTGDQEKEYSDPNLKDVGSHNEKLSTNQRNN
jgi:hypothetical protein